MKYNLNKTVLILKDSLLFSSVDEETLKTVVGDYSVIKSFKKNETVFSKKTNEKCIGVILKGEATVKKEHIVLSRLKPGDIFGAVTLYNDCDEFVNNIIAESDSTVVFINAKGIDFLISKNTDFAKSFIAYLSKRIYFLNSKIESYTMPTAGEKLYNCLAAQAKDGCVILDAKMTDLAKSLNLSRASLYRAFDELCDCGKIIKDGKNIKLL